MIKTKILKWLVVISLIALIIGVISELIFDKGLVIIAIAVFIFDLLTLIFLLTNKAESANQ